MRPPPLAHDPDSFRDGDSWLLLNLINEQLSVVLEKSASYAHQLMLEQNFRSWLENAAHVIERPGRRHA